MPAALPSMLSSTLVTGLLGLGLDWTSRVPFALAAGAPALLIVILVDRFDVRGDEPRWLLRRAALLGALVVLPVLAVELLLALAGAPVRSDDAWTLAASSLLVVAVPEELGKAACLAWLLARRLEFESRRDGLRYGARVGLGFALVENVYYGFLVGEAGSFVLLVAARTVLTVPMHAVWGAMIGDGAARRRLDGDGPGIIGGAAVAALGHGLFDFGLGIAHVADARGDASGFIAAIALVLAVAATAMLAVRRRARAALLADAEAEHAMVPTEPR